MKVERIIWVFATLALAASTAVSAMLYVNEREMREAMDVRIAMHNSNLLHALNQNDRDGLRQQIQVVLEGQLSALDGYMEWRGKSHSRMYQSLVSKLEQQHPEYHAYLIRGRDDGAKSEVSDPANG
ncbi:hypothetical protein [Wenzhouxiangella sediminis]|nr:hypothetical protein [Wenzhouxiangella sediminis]